MFFIVVRWALGNHFLVRVTSLNDACKWREQTILEKK